MFLNISGILNEFVAATEVEDVLPTFSAKMRTFPGTQKLSTNPHKCSKLLEIEACKLEISKLEKC